MNSSADIYKSLIASFVEGKLTAVEVESEYLNLFKYNESRSEDMYEVLNPLFWAVEDFCSYPELKEEGDLDENQLLQVANVTLKKLNKLTPETVKTSLIGIASVKTVSLQDGPGFIKVRGES
ncbi:colicin immunity domain-containing protein [Desulfococcaceae bacterium HSG8]|nr:colicin immunity domain-containing protein [Desulfococcaceae bacterium HSG8]